jgi:hypothetical protein
LSKIVSLFVACLSVFILIWRGFEENGSRQEKTNGGKSCTGPPTMNEALRHENCAKKKLDTEKNNHHDPGGHERCKDIITIKEA